MRVKAYYRTGEVAEIVGCSVSTVKNLSDELSEIIPNFIHRESNNRRLYSLRTVATLQFIYNLEERFTRDDIERAALHVFYNVDCVQ